MESLIIVTVRRLLAILSTDVLRPGATFDSSSAADGIRRSAAGSDSVVVAAHSSASPSTVTSPSDVWPRGRRDRQCVGTGEDKGGRESLPVDRIVSPEADQ